MNASSERCPEPPDTKFLAWVDHNPSHGRASAELATEELAPLRAAIREQRKLVFTYRDERHRISRRVIWPFAIGYFNDGRVIVGFCEARNDYRHFRTDRLSDLKISDTRYTRPRGQMFREWQARQT